MARGSRGVVGSTGATPRTILLLWQVLVERGWGEVSSCNSSSTCFSSCLLLHPLLHISNVKGTDAKLQVPQTFLILCNLAKYSSDVHSLLSWSGRHCHSG